ncbi:MAG: putative colanic acid biosynthesis UDP-glucose lipid carrier transferase [Polyangiales bacterium]
MEAIQLQKSESIRAVADILLAAAHSDSEFCEKERVTVKRVLCELLGTEELPGEIQDQLEDFDPSSFNIREAAETYMEQKDISKIDERRLIELVRKVCDANGAVDLEEDQYMIALVLALRLAPDEFSDLVLNHAEGLHGFRKRVFDVVFSATLIATAWPLLAAIATGVRATSNGPVLFKQRRYGAGGREIEVWKFRTMTVQENGGDVKQATKGDARITRLGAFLRRTSLDELPQFFNVLRGDMSVVGPRPHAVAHNKAYRTRILEYTLRHKVKPGITGWAQVNGWRGETDTLEKMIRRVEHDLDYIRRWSFRMDLLIVWLTVFGVKVRQNAY